MSADITPIGNYPFFPQVSNDIFSHNHAKNKSLTDSLKEAKCSIFEIIEKLENYRLLERQVH